MLSPYMSPVERVWFYTLRIPVSYTHLTLPTSELV